MIGRMPRRYCGDAMSCLDGNDWENSGPIHLPSGDTAVVEAVVSVKEEEVVAVAWVGNLTDGYTRRELTLRPRDCLVVVGLYTWMMQREDMDGD